MSALLPCLHCSSVKASGVGNGYNSWMRCVDCGATGPRTAPFLDWDAAGAAWNRRAPGAGYTAGAEAMREAAVGAAEDISGRYYYEGDRCDINKAGPLVSRAIGAASVAAAIRALPLPAGPVDGDAS